MKTFLPLLAAFVIAGCGSPKDDAAPAAAPAAEDAAGWKVDKSKSTLGFTATQTGNAFKGRFEDFDATIIFDPADLPGSSIKASVSTASAKTGDRQRDDALPGGDWFAAKDFPTAAFASSEIVATGEGRFEARGALTIRDMTRDVALPFTVAIDGSRAIADGALSLVRTDFGVGRGEFATGQWVGLEVSIEVHIEADR